MKKAALFAMCMGLFTLLSFSLLMIKTGGGVHPAQYPNPQGFSSAMVWFELADNAEEVFANLAPVDSTEGT